MLFGKFLVVAVVNLFYELFLVTVVKRLKFTVYAINFVGLPSNFRQNLRVTVQNWAVLSHCMCLLLTLLYTHTHTALNGNLS